MRDSRFLVTRYLFLTDEMAQLLDWKHLQTTIRILVEKWLIETNEIVETEDHYAALISASESTIENLRKRIIPADCPA